MSGERGPPQFAPHATADAATFDFHPDQTLERTADGSLVVRFRAAGHLEMAWLLYQWGDAVEVLAPEPLHALRKGQIGCLQFTRAHAGEGVRNAAEAPRENPSAFQRD